MYFLKGMPLIYGGQETGNKICPDLFGKDTVNWNTGKDLSWLFKALYRIKQKEIISRGVCHLRASDEHGIIVGTYTWGEHKLVGVFSMQGKTAEVEAGVPDGIYKNLIDGSEIAVAEGKLLSPSRPVIIELK